MELEVTQLHGAYGAGNGRCRGLKSADGQGSTDDFAGIGESILMRQGLDVSLNVALMKESSQTNRK
jgi:hypothetical protein